MIDNCAMVYFILTLCKSFRRVLESMAEALDDLIYLLLTDDERGAEGARGQLILK